MKKQSLFLESQELETQLETKTQSTQSPTINCVNITNLRVKNVSEIVWFFEAKWNYYTYDTPPCKSSARNVPDRAKTPFPDLPRLSDPGLSPQPDVDDRSITCTRGARMGITIYYERVYTMHCMSDVLSFRHTSFGVFSKRLPLPWTLQHDPRAPKTIRVSSETTTESLSRQKLRRKKALFHISIARATEYLCIARTFVIIFYVFVLTCKYTYIYIYTWSERERKRTLREERRKVYTPLVLLETEYLDSVNILLSQRCVFIFYAPVSFARERFSGVIDGVCVTLQVSIDCFEKYHLAPGT